MPAEKESNTMIFGAVLAGGVGSRMHMSGMPKQFLPLGEKPIVIHTLEKFLLCSRFDRVYVGVHPQWLLHMQDLVDTYVREQADRVSLVPGGGDRNDTLFRVVAKIEEDFGESDEHVIVTHDSVLPFVTLRMLEENIDGALQHQAVDTVMASTDTIVVSQDGEKVTEIPERRFMYQGQTPQSFNMNLLKKLYADLTAEEKAKLTDAAKIFTLRQYPVYLVQGDVSNMKITTVTDYEIAQAMIGMGRK